MIIRIPNNNVNERKYIIDIIFKEFLGLEYKIEVGSKNYEIKMDNHKILTVKDTFFNKFPNDLEYLALENIPQNIEELDIFAASFFMLSRWEEYVNKNRDRHNRFPATESLAYKQGFLDRPIVNEYVVWLKKELLKLDSSLVFKTYNYKMVLTHDVDFPLRYTSLISGFREIAGDVLKRKSIKKAITNIVLKVMVMLKIEKDPFDTFDYLMDMSEKYNLKSHFFFMAKGLTSYDNMYKNDGAFIKSLVKRIKERGHHIGIHPTYNAYNDCVQFRREKEELEKNLNTKVIFGREHYLRFEVPTTWQIWEDNKMEWDSTLSYADKEGFRCGVCYPYSVFNILTRKKLNLKEKPLIVMEGSFLTYQTDLSPETVQKIIEQLIFEVKKHGGEFVLLWHNSSFNTPKFQKYQEVYERLITK